MIDTMINVHLEQLLQHVFQVQGPACLESTLHEQTAHVAAPVLQELQ